MKTLLTVILALSYVLAVRGQIHTATVEYKDGDTVLEGYLAYEQAHTQKPGVLIVHQWKGLGDNEKKRAEMLAKLGYVAFAVDIYGKGIRPQDPQAAAAEAGKYKQNRALLRQRVRAGLIALQTRKVADPNYIAAIGYCFGGAVAQALAFSGAPLAGIVSFHGSLIAPSAAAAAKTKARLLICHGAVDPFISKDEIEAFKQAVDTAKLDYQFISYAGAIHAFTNPKADEVAKDQGMVGGIGYNAAADRRSWAQMQGFFAEIFAKK